jgi:hypothetical protein
MTVAHSVAPFGGTSMRLLAMGTHAPHPGSLGVWYPFAQARAALQTALRRDANDRGAEGVRLGHRAFDTSHTNPESWLNERSPQWLGPSVCGDLGSR